MEQRKKIEKAGEGGLQIERERLIRDLGDLAGNLRRFSELDIRFPLREEAKEKVLAIKKFFAAHEENITALAVALGSAGAKIWESLDLVVGSIQSAQGSPVSISWNSLESQDFLKALGAGAAAFVFQKQISKYWPQFEKFLEEFKEFLDEMGSAEAEFFRRYGKGGRTPI